MDSGKITAYVIFALLLVFNTVFLTACNVIPAISREKYTNDDYVPDENAVVYDTNGISSEKYKSSEEELGILDRMKLQLENEYLALYTGQYYDIAVLDKQTNKVFFSNKGAYMYEEEKKLNLSDETKKVLFSQISLEYADKNHKFRTLSSYPDCFEQNGRIDMDKNGKALSVKYVFGSESRYKLIVPAFTIESYKYYDDILKKMVEEGKLNLMQYSNFANNYELVTYEKLDIIKKNQYKEKYPKIEELGQIYILKPNLSAVSERKVAEITQILGITREVIEQESEKLGGVDYDNNTPYFEIPVIYELQGRDLIARIDTKNIVSGEGYYITRINFLQSFGATRPDEEGYLFAPQASGVIIYNDTEVYKINSMDIPFYGTDFAKNHQDLSAVGYDAVFPVFGLKAGDCAVFGIVESGEALGGASIMLHNAYWDYNTLYPYFYYFTHDNFNREGVALAFSRVTPVVPYVVRYHFLYGDDANYSGMARYYQKYLEQRGIIERGKASRELVLDINFIGSITKKVKVLGVPVERNIAVTSFEQAGEIIDKLNAGGINKISVLYSGVMNNGLDYKSPARVKIENCLGGLDGYRKFISESESKGNLVFTDVDITKVYEKGNGISSGSDFSKFLNKNSAIMTFYSPLDNRRAYRRMAALVNPLKYGYVIDSFIKQYNKTGHKNIYLSSVGKYLNSNFNQDSELTREEVKILTVNELEKLTAKGYKLKMDSGNAYVLKYADSLTNVSLSSSNTRLEGQSVPFIGMVLKGYMDFTGEPINQARDYEKAFLKVVENGAGLSYMLVAADDTVFMDTRYLDFYSLNADIWIERIISSYNKLNADLGGIADKRITDHCQVAENVFRITYENGTRVFINYNYSDAVVDNVKIGALSYTVVN